MLLMNNERQTKSIASRNALAVAIHAGSFLLTIKFLIRDYEQKCAYQSG